MILHKLFLIFILVMVMFALKRPIYVGMTVGCAAAWLLYGITFEQGISALIKSCTSWDTLSLIVVMYIVTFIQNMMAKRNAIPRASHAISALFNNRWVDCAAAPIFIGMLPTPNAAFIVGDIIQESAGEYLNTEEKAVATSYFRHVSESFMPTYNSILTALVIAGVAAGDFVVHMLPIVAVIIASGCFWLLRGRVPMKTGKVKSEDRKHHLKELVSGLWPIVFIIVLVVLFKFEVYYAALIGLIAYFVLARFSFGEIKNLFAKSLQAKLYLNILTIMFFKELLALSGAVTRLTEFFTALPLPVFIVFPMIFFFGTIVSGNTTMIVLCLPAAMAVLPGAKVEVLILIMGTLYCASQLSPTHICLSLIADHYGIPLTRLFKKTLPSILSTCVFTLLYYLLLVYVI